MAMNEQEFAKMMAERRENYRAQQKALEAEWSRINLQKRVLKKEFKEGNKMLNEAFGNSQPTEHSILNHRRRDAYNIKRFIGGKLSEWNTAWLDTAQAGVGFEIKDDCIQFGITIPFKDPRKPQDEDQA